MELAKEGSLPGPPFKHGGRAEFLCRCGAALLRSNPSAEGNVSKLSAEEQNQIRYALASEAPPYDGCLNESCMDKKPKWIDRTVSIPTVGGRWEEGVQSRCAYCNYPKWLGRKWRSNEPGCTRIADLMCTSFS